MSEAYLLFGNRKLVLLVDDAEVEHLIDEDFKFEDKHKMQMRLKDLLIKTEYEGAFFGHELKIAIDSLVIYIAKPVKPKVAAKASLPDALNMRL